MRIVRPLLCALSCVGFASAASAQLLRVPHTFVSLSPPAGFTATRAFGGFENRRAGWTIRVLELGPEAYPQFAAAFSSAERATAAFGSGIRITRIDQLALDSGAVSLAVGVQQALGRELVKYMALMGDGRAATVVITFELSPSSTLGRDDVEAVLHSVKIGTPTTVTEWRAELPFEFREAPPFHATEGGPGWVRLAAFDGPDASSNPLTMTIRRNPIVARPAETAETNLDLIHSAFSKTATIVEQRAEVFAGGPGDFIMASADGQTVFQFMRVLPDRTEARLSAVGESRAMEDARDAVMDIARSVELRE
jgi:hypothetical protein